MVSGIQHLHSAERPPCHWFHTVPGPQRTPPAALPLLPSWKPPASFPYLYICLWGYFLYKDSIVQYELLGPASALSAMFLRVPHTGGRAWRRPTPFQGWTRSLTGRDQGASLHSPSDGTGWLPPPALTAPAAVNIPVQVCVAISFLSSGMLGHVVHPCLIWGKF